MYIQGNAQYNYHVEHYGHPSKFGFMEIDNLWKAEKWEPERLMARYARAGAKYFMSLANHHDNFDNLRLHPPCLELNQGRAEEGHHRHVGAFGQAAPACGSAYRTTPRTSWHWFQTAYGYDAEGAQKGVRYDAYNLTKADGKGKWWDGLDPQELYVGRNMVMPDGIATARDAQRWHEQNDRKWTELAPTVNPQFTENWFLRCQELLDKYQPDMIYFDNTELPLEQAGLDIAAHYYNSSIKKHGKLEAVIFCEGTEARPRRNAGARYRTGPRGPHLADAVADRYLYRGMALQAVAIRPATDTRRRSR